MSKQVMTTFSIRIPAEFYRKLRFISADQDKSLNQLITEILQEATAKAHISVPTDLLLQ
ncbi:MAG: toxin-antitoxin system HicB family antitoxin [Synergistaceae bacterium]|nr:toxin-antitoxin system HicB family antitoxin [Synergistaceae bacterium]MBR0080088.1 toxin-antitoxin system HicB family antitoxin [Synergistaceae bacterium]MBR0315912.1 toxin-antitoxin system HicB family antitoxin [Synergistaceae bacterium]